MHIVSSTKSFSTKTLFGGGIIAGLGVSFIVAVIVAIAPFAAPTGVSDSSTNVLDVSSFRDGSKNVFLATHDYTDLGGMSYDYHRRMNALVNAQVDAFMNKNGSTDVPETDDACFANGGGDKPNISTYCLFVRADAIYSQYRAALAQQSDTSIQDIRDILGSNEYIGDGSGLSIQAVEQAKTRRAQWIADELSTSRTVFDRMLEAYSELLNQYDMHVAYVDTVKYLINYYHALVEVRKKVDTYPKRFIDVTTPYCQ